MLFKGPVPKMARDGTMPPFTDAKLNMMFGVMIKACIYNQSDVTRWTMYACLGVSTLVAIYWYFSNLNFA